MKSKLKWRLKEVGFDPERHAQILNLLYDNHIDRPEIGLTHTELNALATEEYLQYYPEDEDCILEGFARDEAEGTYAKLVRNQALRSQYADCGGMVDGEWRWYAQPPAPQPAEPMERRVAEVVCMAYGHERAKEMFDDYQLPDEIAATLPRIKAVGE